MVKNSSLYDENYYYNVETFTNLTDDYLDKFIHELNNHPDYETLKNKFIIDRKKKKLIQIHEKIPLKEMEGLDKEQSFFYPLCSKKEINQIFNVKNNEDYLLKFRAEQIVDNQRLHRVFDSIRRKKGKEWNFSQYFNTSLFQTYLDHLPDKEKKICQTIPHGTIHLNDANGYCIKTPYGNVIIVSLALRQFLYYMNLFHFGEQFGFNKKEKLPTYILAVRILRSESLDFEIDSRGDIPSEIHDEIDNITDWQILFIIGHEYAHHYLKHLEETPTLSYAVLNKDDFKFYSFKQKQELDADYHSIIKQKISDKERSVLANSAFLFFQWLDLYQTVRDYMFPSTRMPSTHPSPKDRIFELRERLDSKFGFSQKELEEQIKTYSEFKKNLIKEYIPFNIEKFEIYGSVYLDSYKKNRIHDRLL